MSDSGNTKSHADALAMIDAFASVGATRFDVILTTRAGEQDDWCRRAMPLVEMRRDLLELLDSAARCELNVHVRPYGSDRAFIQLDDLNADTLARVAPAAFLALQTSPGNFQAWVVISGRDDREFARRLRKGSGADDMGSWHGATRVAGSFNFKDKYAPDFPRVAIHQASAGRITSADELDRLGLVASPLVLHRCALAKC